MITEDQIQQIGQAAMLHQWPSLTPEDLIDLCALALDGLIYKHMTADDATKLAAKLTKLEFASSINEFIDGEKPMSIDCRETYSLKGK